MIICATLTNPEGCQFDSLRLQISAAQENGALREIKNWAAGRSGKYTLTAEKKAVFTDVWIALGEWKYSGQCRKAVAA